jgi:hypothetical protein
LPSSPAETLEVRDAAASVDRLGHCRTAVVCGCAWLRPPSASRSYSRRIVAARRLRYNVL